jgi:hypothetical protein
MANRTLFRLEQRGGSIFLGVPESLLGKTKYAEMNIERRYNAANPTITIKAYDRLGIDTLNLDMNILGRRQIFMRMQQIQKIQ